MLRHKLFSNDEMTDMIEIYAQADFNSRTAGKNAECTLIGGNQT